MTGNHPAALLRRLNPYCARALDAAASLCQTRAHAEITIEHWLLKLLEQGEGDITVIARLYEWDIDTLWQSLLAHLDTLPRSVRERPQLSEPLTALIRQAWLIASLEGDDPQIRSQHLLMALTEKPMLPACNDLWVLLSLSRVQLERLRPLLDAQSDECPARQPQVTETLTSAQPEAATTDAPAKTLTGKQDDALLAVLNRFTEDVTEKARSGRWMWTPAPSPRWWRTGPASRSLPCSGTNRATCSAWNKALKTALSGNARRSAPSHSGCGRLKQVSRRRMAHRGYSC